MIYYVEDDQNIRELVLYTLRSGGLEALGFERAGEFKAALKEERPALVILDIMLPEEDGLSILADLKKREETKTIPVIMVTAKGSEYDKVVGLDAGADDYISKPFGMMEFLSRVKAVLRRAGMNEDPEHKETIYTHGKITMDVEKHRVTADSEEVELTYKEFELLKYLLENPGIVETREKLLSDIWGYDFDGETRTVDVHIRMLRQKLGEQGSSIETVRGVGYRMGVR